MLMLPSNIPLFNFYTVAGKNIVILQLQYKACVSGSCDGNKLVLKNTKYVAPLLQT